MKKLWCGKFLVADGQMEDLLDLNAMDNTTINVTAEYFDIDRIIFLSNMTDFITPNGVRIHIELQCLQW